MHPLTAYALGAASAALVCLAVVVALLALAAWDTRRLERLAAHDRHPSTLTRWTAADDAALTALLADHTDR